MGTSAGREASGGSTGDGEQFVPNDAGNEGTTGSNAGSGSGEQAESVQAGNGLRRDKLNPLIRGMSEEDLNQTFDALLNAVRAPVNAAPAPAPEAVKPKEISNEDLRERFDPTSDKFDPRGAVTDLVSQNYGGLIQDITNKANSGLKQNLRNKLPDFEQYEAQIDEALKNVPPAHINEALIANTYFAAVGVRQTQERLKERNKPPTTREPSPQRRDNKPTLSEEEKQVARAMFRNSADPEGDYVKAQKMMDEGYQMKVPGDK